MTANDISPMKTNNCSFIAAILLAATLVFTGCATTPSVDNASIQENKSDLVILREGDLLKISFPGSPNLDASQQIRRDGKITLSLVGEVEAAGLSPDALQKKLIELYASQISSKEINVALQTSTFPVFVNGAVVRPGKILSDHPITALEAIMEAGGFDFTTANMKAVKILRNEGGSIKNFQINLKEVLEGKSDKSFYLKPGDIIYVPERFQMF